MITHLAQDITPLRSSTATSSQRLWLPTSALVKVETTRLWRRSMRPAQEHITQRLNLVKIVNLWRSVLSVPRLGKMWMKDTHPSKMTGILGIVLLSIILQDNQPEKWQPIIKVQLTLSIAPLNYHHIKDPASWRLPLNRARQSQSPSVVRPKSWVTVVLIQSWTTRMPRPTNCSIKTAS